MEEKGEWVPYPDRKEAAKACGFDEKTGFKDCLKSPGTSKFRAHQDGWEIERTDSEPKIAGSNWFPVSKFGGTAPWPQVSDQGQVRCRAASVRSCCCAEGFLVFSV